MFIIQDKKIISERDLRISKTRLVQLMFLFMDTTFQTADKFTLTAGETTNSFYGFTKSGFLKFAKVDFNFIDKQSSQVEITIYQGAEIILQDTLFVQAEIQGGKGESDVQGIIFNNVDSLVTEVKVIPPSITANATDFTSMFSRCRKLIEAPYFDCSKGTNFSSCFNGCYKLTKIPQLNFSNGTKFNSLFYQCYELLEIPEIIDVSKGTDFFGMFFFCEKLTKIPALNVANGTNFQNMFGYCNELTDFGGLLNVRYGFDLIQSKKLTHDSLLNVLNGLADLTGSTTQTLKLGSTNLAKLTDQEKSIATNKNWNLA